MRQYHCCSLYKLTRWKPFPHLVRSSSRSVLVPTNVRYSYTGQIHSGLPQCDSGPPSRPNQSITTERSPQNSEPILQDVGNSISGHVCHRPQHASSPVYVPSSRASSTGDRCSITRLAGEVDVHVLTLSPAQQSHSEAQDHPGGEVILIARLVASQPWFPHLLHLYVDHPLLFHSYTPGPTITTGICLGRQVIPSAHMDAPRSTSKQHSFQMRSLDSPQLLKGPIQTMYDDRWLCFTHWAAGQGIDPLYPTAAQIAAFL